MADVKMPHAGHDRHLCYLNNLGIQTTNPQEYKSLIKNGRFYCQNCGRVAGDENNLCKPVKL